MPLNLQCLSSHFALIAGGTPALQSTKRLVFALQVFLVLAFASLTANAAPFANYDERVHEAISLLEDLVSETGDLELSDEVDTLLEVRETLPQTETVETDRGKTVVDNRWLHLMLDDYLAMRATLDGEKRAEKLNEIVDRLYALDARLVELEKGHQARDKDAEKGRLANILRKPEYNRKASEGGALQKLIQQFFEWLRSIMPQTEPIRPGSGKPSFSLQIVVIALSIITTLFIIVRFWLGRRGRVKSAPKKEPRVVLGERIAADQTALDLLADAEMLAREGDLRGAIRKAYVALLCELGDRRVLRLAQHKTNRDYLQAVRKEAPAGLYDEMRPLTFDFERHWYGSEEADQSDWAEFRTRCKQALNLK